MKRVVIISMMLLICTLSMAQKAELGIVAGPNFNSIKLQSSGTTIYGHSTGFHAGFMARKVLNPGFAIQPQLMITARGGDWSTGDDVKTRVLALELPVNFLYVEKNFFVGAGPAFRYGLSASFKSEDVKIDAYNKTEADSYLLKRFELGASVVAGYKFNSGLSLSASYNPGFTDLNETADITTSGFAISVGYFFR